MDQLMKERAPYITLLHYQNFGVETETLKWF